MDASRGKNPEQTEQKRQHAGLELLQRQNARSTQRDERQVTKTQSTKLTWDCSQTRPSVRPCVRAPSACGRRGIDQHTATTRKSAEQAHVHAPPSYSKDISPLKKTPHVYRIRQRTLLLSTLSLSSQRHPVQIILPILPHDTLVHYMATHKAICTMFFPPTHLRLPTHARQLRMMRCRSVRCDVQASEQALKPSSTRARKSASAEALEHPSTQARKRGTKGP